MIAAVCAIQNMKKPYGFKLLKKLQLIFFYSITTYIVFNEKINYLFLFLWLGNRKKYNIKIKIFAMVHVTRLKSPKFDILRYL